MRSVADYLAKIPPLNAGKAKFAATIEAVVAAFADNQAFLDRLPQAFDLDTAVGVQLDKVGEWVGRSRQIPIPVLQPWFSWAIPKRGWGQAYWKGPDILRTRLATLDDETYRRLLRAKIRANYSSGLLDDAQAALAIYFLAPTLIFSMDKTIAIGWTPETRLPWSPTSGMDWQIGVSGQLPTVVDLEILAQDLIPVKPLGVNVDVKVTTVNGAPLFGWGIDNQYVAGWGKGAWGASPEYVVDNIA